jgi:hypothetical protein
MGPIRVRSPLRPALFLSLAQLRSLPEDYLV